MFLMYFFYRYILHCFQVRVQLKVAGRNFCLFSHKTAAHSMTPPMSINIILILTVVVIHMHINVWTTHLNDIYMYDR